MRLCYLLLVVAVASSGLLCAAADTTHTAISSPDSARAIVADNKRLLRAKNDDGSHEERAFGFNILSKLKNLSTSTGKSAKSKILMPNAKQLEMMAYRDDIAYPFFKDWVQQNLPLTTVRNIVKDGKIADNFGRYKIIAKGGL